MKRMYIRLDDACERMDVSKWMRIEALLDKFDIKPLVGVIPHCEDAAMSRYATDEAFWEKVNKWRQKGWIIAMHGYNHVYSTNSGGINPVNYRSEFAGEPLSVQKEKIRKGIQILESHCIKPDVFFAPSHTFDLNTLEALKTESNIRIISDTIAFSEYSDGYFTFVPQQSGRIRKLPFKSITFCLHPNTMTEQDFAEIEEKFKSMTFSAFCTNLVSRKKNLLDKLLSWMYFHRTK